MATAPQERPGEAVDARRSNRSAVLHVGGACDLACAGCDCRNDPSPERDVARVLSAGGGRLVLRGSAASLPDGAQLVRRAREAGYVEIVARTSAVACATPDGLAAHLRLGLDGVIVPVFSHAPQVHDQVAGRPMAFVRAMAGMQALARAGLTVEIEAPLLHPRAQRPDALVEQVRRFVPSLKAVRFFVPDAPQPPALTPPRWSEGAPWAAA
jgi:MoaA/NifB/PqqE/SkfB family radical SAM enzyme